MIPLRMKMHTIPQEKIVTMNIPYTELTSKIKKNLQEMER